MPSKILCGCGSFIFPDYELTIVCACGTEYPPVKEPIDNDCVFCRIVAGVEPATVLWRDVASMVIVPLNPVTDGHVIAIPFGHASDFATSWYITADAMYAAFEYTQTLTEDFNIITSKGVTATQSVFHLHVHIVPRRENDGLALPWYSGKRKKEH